ncbi:hypothetical protein SBOR_8284 [Sclerotinia borealis F-4128]|uniref:Family c-likeg-protein-coupled receptor protein n=1 Tax=Sclerotinia borealis (strain F-4128) TaxID=1432307 RepID=W9C6K0_SCLBF|nr:hypothetical protein SBOR_8284 [Sclerotinia borealis F-4128]
MSPPYPPENASLGLTPTNNVDTPISAIFMILFLLAAIIHMSILKINFRRGQKFIMSGMAFGFSCSRVITCIMRIVWASYPTNIKIALAAQIFVAVGTILLLLINMIFTSRLLRAYHTWAWNIWIRMMFRVAYVSLFVGLIAVISVTVDMFFTLDPNVLRIDHEMQVGIDTYFAVYAFMPVPLLALRLLFPLTHLVTKAKDRSSVEKFGTGRFRTKVRLVLFTSILLTLAAAFRAGTAYIPRPIDNPAWYNGKACFYIFDFMMDIIVLYIYAVMRMDRRFIVPNGTKDQGDFRVGGAGGLPVKGGEGAGVLRWEWMRGWKGEWREWEVQGDDEVFCERERNTVGERKGNGDVEEGDTYTETVVNTSGGVTPEIVGSREDIDIDIEKGGK